MSIVTFAAVAFFLGAMLFAGLMDLLTMKIRNALVIALLLGYAAFAPFAGLGTEEVAASVAVALLVFIGAFVCFALGWIGGGDAKLAAVAALWIGADQVSAYLLGTALVGGCLTVALIGFRQAPLPAGFAASPWIARLHRRDVGVPYGVALAAAAVAVFPHTFWLESLR